MIPKELVELLFINFCINPFHMQEAWKIFFLLVNPVLSRVPIAAYLYYMDYFLTIHIVTWVFFISII